MSEDDELDDETGVAAGAAAWDVHNETVAYDLSYDVGGEAGSDPWGGAENRTQRLGSIRVEGPRPSAAWVMAPPAGIDDELPRASRSRRARRDDDSAKNEAWRSWSLAPPAGVDDP